jgi:nitroreductase
MYAILLHLVGGLQSFEIYSIDNLEIKNQIVKASMDQEFIAEAPLLLVFCANPTRSSKYGKKAELFSIQEATSLQHMLN